MARNKKVEILSNDKEVLHPMTDGDCVIFEDGQTLTQKLSEDDSVKYTPEIVNSSPMFKVGEGNTVDYSDNVLDGAYERATLQGQTYVNYIQESSADEVTLPTPFTEYERTQHNTLTSDEEGTLGINLVGQSYVNALQHDSEEEFVVLGESLEFQEKKVEYTNEGQIKSAMLKGQTLVNLANQSDLKVEGGKLTKDKGVYTLTVDSNFNSTYVLTYSNNVHQFKPNTKYLVKTNVIENNFTTSFNPCVGHNSNIFDLDETEKAPMNYQPGETGTKIGTFTTKSDFTGVTNAFRFAAGALANPCVANQTIKFQFIFVEYQDGMENWDIPYFEGMQSVTMTTELENVCSRYNSSGAKNGKTFTVSTAAATRYLELSTASNISNYNFKPNTKYLIQFKISNLNMDGLESLALVFSNGTISQGNALFGDNSQVIINKNGVYRAILTTSNIISTSDFIVKGTITQWEDTTSTLRKLTISEIMCVEYQNGMENWDLPYFEDYQVMKPVQVESVSKNLASVNTFQLTSQLDSSTGSATLNQVIEVNIPLNPSLEYVFTSDNQHITALCTNEPIPHSVYQHGHNNCYTHTKTTGGKEYKYPNNLVSGYKYITITTGGAAIDYDVGQTVTFNNIQIEESSTATEYVPHQSKTTYSWDEVILRKVGDVEDTLDLTTGEWVQRIGEIVLDGSEYKFNQTPGEVIGDNVVGGWSGIYGINAPKKTSPSISSDIPTRIYTSDGNPYEDKEYFMVGINTMILSLSKTRLNGKTIEQYLTNNPIKVQYVLTKPIVHKVNLSRPNLQVYDDITHIHTKCLDGTLIPNIYLPSDISYPAILEPGKTYNICVNHTEVSEENPLKVNVGGTEITMTDSRMTLTTPATLANSNVSFTGKGNKIKESMLIKNSSLLTRDLPHFNGIGSVQLGKTIENLCSASGFKAGNSDTTIAWYDDYAHTNVSNKTGSCVFVYELVKPLENGKKYFVYSPQTLDNTSCRVSFRRVYNNSLSYARQQTVLPKNGKCIIEIDQTDNPYTHICVGCHHEIPLNTEFDMYRPIICEYEPGMENWDWESIGYFTGTKNIGNEFMKVQNKNLFITNNATYGTIHYNKHDDYFIVNNSKTRVTMKELIKVNKNSTLTLSCNNSFNCVIQEYISPIQRTLDNDGGWKNNHTLVLNEKTNYVNIYFRKPDDAEFTDTEMEELKNSIQLEESSTATPYTAHKHNGLYITKDQPIDLTWEQGQVLIDTYGSTYTSTINNSLTTRVRNKGLLNLKPNTTYRISSGDKTNFKYHIACFDNGDCSVKEIEGMSSGWASSVDTIFTTTEDMHKISINVAKVSDGTITPSESVHAQVRLEEVTDVVLRGIDDVHDELDLTRGVYIQRIGEAVLDGSDDEIWYPSGLNQDLINAGHANIVFYYNQQNNGTIPNLKISPYDSMANIICDKLQSIIHKDQLDPTFRDCSSICGGATATEIRIAIPVDNTEEQKDSATCKAWLKANPIRVQYELATPIVHKVHIGNKDEVNTEVNKPNDVFTLPTLYTEQTHIDLTNNGIMPKVQSRDYIAYPVSPMIGRTYTLQHNLTGGVSNLTVDLLGRTQSVSYQNHKSLIYSPETMDAVLHNELRISGKGKISRVMYIDGGYMDREIPYIEGMKNAVNPIVKNIGKNLFDINDLYSDRVAIIRENEFQATSTNLSTFIDVKVKPHTQYRISYEIYRNLGNTSGLNMCVHDGKNTGYFDSTTHILVSSNVPSSYEKRTHVFTSKSDYISLSTLDGNYIKNLIITETNVENEYEPYKENICYVDCGEIRLTPDMFEQGNIVYNNTNTGATYDSMKEASHIRIRTKELIKIKPNTEYLLNVKGGYRVFVREFDVNKGKLNDSALSLIEFQSRGVFTTNANTQYISLLIGNLSDTSLPLSDFDKFNLLLIEKDNMVILRSLPNGVRDELNLQTGEYIQRVGEMTLNDNDYIIDYFPAESTNEYSLFAFVKNDIKNAIDEYDKTQALCDKLSYEQIWNNKEKEGFFISNDRHRIFIRISNDKLSEQSVDALNEYLSSNPIKVQYQLETPIIKQVGIHNYPHSYEGGHVIIESGDPNTLIPAQLKYRVVTNRSGQIQQHTEQVEKQEREINELETLILANIHLSQTR